MNVNQPFVRGLSLALLLCAGLWWVVIRSIGCALELAAESDRPGQSILLILTVAAAASVMVAALVKSRERWPSVRSRRSHRHHIVGRPGL